MRKWLTIVTAIFLIAAICAGCAGSNDETQETTEVVRGDLITSVSVRGNLEMPRRVNLSRTGRVYRLASLTWCRKYWLRKEIM
jgi:hypothetical protein